MRAVLDTNVVVSALIWGGKPFGLFQFVSDGHLKLYTSPALLDELRRVLTRSHLVSRLEQKRSSAERALARCVKLTQSIVPDSTPRIVPGDPDDDHFLAAAVAAKADLLVSGDNYLSSMGNYGEIRIVTPAEALRILATSLA